MYLDIERGKNYGVLAKLLDSSLEVIEFELQFRYCVHFRTNTLGKDMNVVVFLTIG